MRVTGSILALSLLVSAAPALAQGSGSYDSGYPYGRQYTNQNRYEYYPQQQDQTRYGQGQQGPWSQSGSWQQGQYGQNQQGPWSQGGSYQPGGSWQQGQYGQMPYGSQGGNAPSYMGQMGQSTPGPVSFSAQSQIRQSLESSGFKNVSVLPQSFLIRAMAPDGSRVLMQVSGDSLYGVVVNPTDQAATSGTGNSASTGGTSSSANTSGDNTSPGNTSSGHSSSNTGSGNSSSAGNTTSGGGGSTGSTAGSTTGGSGSAGNTTGGSTSAGTAGSTGTKSGTSTSSPGGTSGGNR